MRAVHACLVLLAMAVVETVALPSFTVAAAADAPTISVNPTTLSFGTVAVGASADQTVTISNAGTITLTVSSIALASGAASKYTVSATALNIAAGGAQTITVTYAPTAETTDNDQLVITSNDPVNATRSVALSGSGASNVAGNIALSPTSLDFGSLDVGTAKQLTAQIANTGARLLIVASIDRCANTSEEFTWTTAQPAPFPIASQQSATLTVTYTANSTGVHTGCLVIKSDDLQTPTVNLNVTGTGNPRSTSETSAGGTGCSTGQGSAAAALILLAAFTIRHTRGRGRRSA